jgi:hypothetical protein
MLSSLAPHLTLILSTGTFSVSAKLFLVVVLGFCCCWKWASRMSCWSFVKRGFTSAEPWWGGLLGGGPGGGFAPPFGCCAGDCGDFSGVLAKGGI